MQTTEERLEGNKENKLAFVLDRLQKMETERSKVETERLICEKQVDSPTFTDNEGKIIYNTQIDQNLLEQYVGRTNNKIYFDFKPEQQADANDIKSSEAITEYFMEKENWYKELAIRDYSKWKYGTWLRYTGLTMDIEKKYKPKEGAETDDNISWGIDDNNLFEEYVQVNWSFTGKNIRIRDLYIDDKAIWQNDWDKVEDVIRVEYISSDKLEERRGDNKLYDISDLEPSDWERNKDTIKLHYYYNKITKDYIIIWNKRKQIYAGKNKYKGWKLPFELCQHYPDDSCIYGKSIPRKTRAAKGYQVNMMQAMLDKTWSSSFNNIILGNGNVIDNQYRVGWGINIREVSNIADFSQFQNNWDINWLAAVIEILRDEIRQNTWEDPRAAFETAENTLWQTEIVEENKAVRVRAVQISRDLCLDNVITRAYENIQQFAPVLLRKTESIKTEDWKEVKKVIRPVISLPGLKVIKKGGKQIVEDVEDYGYYGWYELNPKFRLIDGNVKVVTNSSYNKAWSVLEKSKVWELINNLSVLAQIYGPEVLSSAPFKDIRAMVQQAYGYDTNNQYSAQTKKDKIREQNLKLLEEIRDKMKLEGFNSTQPIDENIDQPTVWWPTVQNPSVWFNETGDGEDDVLPEQV